MFCDQCGTPMNDPQTYCPSCGKPTRVAAPAVRSRVAGHVRSLGIFWLAYSAVQLMGSWFLASIFPRFFDSRFLEGWGWSPHRSEEHTSELQSLRHLVCRLLLE